MKKSAKTILALSIFPQIVLVKILSNHPQLVETYYSKGLYPLLSKGFRWAFGWLPFSVGDIFYTILGVLILRFFITKGALFFKETRNFFRKVFIVLSLAYFVFHLFWGMNYYRQPIYKTLGIKNDYTTEELLDFTNRLIEKTNQAHFTITNDRLKKVNMPYTKAQVYKMTPTGFDALKQDFPNLAYKPSSIKTSIYSLPLTYMGYSGYLNPFTNEAQTNGLLLDYKFPLVSCHEVTHQLGYSAENEANFLGFLAAKHNPDKYFQYSAYAYILRYCLGEVKNRDQDAFEKLNSNLNPGIIKNYIEVAEFWKKYKNKAEPVFKESFNTFLKANNQKHGIKSYNYVVALLINYYQNRSL
jgi:hypothetical protein